MMWTREQEVELRTAYEKLGYSGQEFEHLTRAWSEKQKKSDLQWQQQCERDDLVRTRNENVIDGWRRLAYVVLAEQNKLKRIFVKLTPKELAELQRLSDSAFDQRDECITIHRSARLARLPKGGYELYDTSYATVADPFLHEDRTSVLGYPPLSAKISKLVYDAMIQGRLPEPAEKAAELKKVAIHLTPREIRFLDRAGKRNRSAVLRSILDDFIKRSPQLGKYARSLY